MSYFFFFQAEDGIRDYKVTGVQTCALPIFHHEGDRTVRPLEGGGTIRVARVDRHTIGAHPLGRREGNAHAIASAKPRNSASSTSSSGCHWTASTRGAPGSSHSAPSMTPSSAQAVARSAGAMSRIAW